MTETRLRAVVADDHPLVREGLRALLSLSTDIDVVGEAMTGEQAVDVVLDARPDVTVMDLEMPDGSGVDATRKICAAWPDARILVLTMHDHDASVFAAMRAGARGFVLKHAAPAEVIRAVRAVAAGEAIFSPAIASRLVGFFSATRAQAVPFPELTEREREVLEQIARGEANAQIARKLVVSPKTVRNHITNIFMKMQVADRAEAIARARDVGLGQPGP